MKYFGIYNNSGDVQTALDSSALTKPYVAIVSGALDYNTVEPSVPYIGVWTNEIPGRYSFQVIDEDPSYWVNETNIASTHLYDAGSYNFGVMLSYVSYGNGEWNMKFLPDDPDASEFPEYNFAYGVADVWQTGAFTDEGESDGNVNVAYDGEGTFTFYAESQDNPLSMTTINPGYPEESDPIDPSE